MKGVIALLAASAAAIILFILYQNPSCIASFSRMTNEGYLTGTVYHSDGAPFNNFKLIIYSGDALVKITYTQADGDGRYGLPLNIGDYRIVTSQGTYNVTIESGKTTTLNIPA